MVSVGPGRGGLRHSARSSHLARSQLGRHPERRHVSDTAHPLPPCRLWAWPYEAHFIWSGNGRHSKRQRMREAMLYHDPPEYYSEPKLLSVQPRYLKVGGAIDATELILFPPGVDCMSQCDWPYHMAYGMKLNWLVGLAWMASPSGLAGRLD
jgi:hypothetical protein